MEEKRQRIRLLDILRGFAILGTLGTNIWIFANLGDLAYVFTMDHAEWWSSVDDLIRLVVLFLVNGKLLGLLTIMFGVGLEFKYRQSLRKGTAWPRYLFMDLLYFIAGRISSFYTGDGVRYFNELRDYCHVRFLYCESW